MEDRQSHHRQLSRVQVSSNCQSTIIHKSQGLVIRATLFALVLALGFPTLRLLHEEVLPQIDLATVYILVTEKSLAAARDGVIKT